MSIEKQLTVATLISILQKQPSDAVIVLDGYNLGGCESAYSAELTDLAEISEGAIGKSIKAVLISR